MRKKTNWEKKYKNMRVAWILACIGNVCFLVLIFGCAL